MSIAQDIYKAFDRAEKIGATCMQIFTKSNRQWNAKPLDQKTIIEFKERLKNSPVKNIVVHAGYLINVGSPNQETAKKSTIALTQELQRTEQLDIPYLIVHPGSCLASPEDQCLKQIATNIDAVLGKSPGKTMLLLENMAGQGSTMGHTFEQLKTIHRHIKQKKRIGFCFDTCHAFAAGYDFSTPEKYHAMWHNFDRIIGIKHIKAMHLNDSKNPFDSHTDRHEHIGKGKIGIQAFDLLINDQRFFNIPKILETPVETENDYIKDFTILVNLLNKKNEYLLYNNPLSAYKK